MHFHVQSHQNTLVNNIQSQEKAQRSYFECFRKLSITGAPIVRFGTKCLSWQKITEHKTLYKKRLVRKLATTKIQSLINSTSNLMGSLLNKRAITITYEHHATQFQHRNHTFLKITSKKKL